MARDCRKTTKYIQDRQTNTWSDTDDKGKRRLGNGKGRQGKGKGQRATGSKGQRRKGKKQNTPRHEREEHSHQMEGTTPRQTHKPVGSAQNGRIHLGISLTTGLTQTGGPVTEAQILGMNLHGIQQHDSWYCRNLLQNSLIQRPEAASQC